jgi:hypothetical protein
MAVFVVKNIYNFFRFKYKIREALFNYFAKIFKILLNSRTEALKLSKTLLNLFVYLV